MDEFDHAFKQALTNTGITIIDVPVDYSRNTPNYSPSSTTASPP
jgi:thiamine pyrophosphate-dependent acetolactate synthase large subunit-like protein